MVKIIGDAIIEDNCLIKTIVNCFNDKKSSKNYKHIVSNFGI